MTDFGEDHYVGQMKLVIKGINPNLSIIDFTHEIEKQNIKQASFLLSNVIKYVPENSIIQLVVDPGVGSQRDILLVELDRNIFVICPDNGILSKKLNIIRSYKLNEEYINNSESNTFHGRDVFSKISANLSIDFQLDRYFLPFKTQLNDTNLTGNEIIFHDDFGNAITNAAIKSETKVIFREKKYDIHKTFSDVDFGEIVFYKGSFNTLEIAIRNGNLKKDLGTRNGEKVKLIN